MEGAVVTAAEGAVKTLLGKLSSLLVEEAQLLGGVLGEVQYIKDELQSMNAFLEDLAERDDHSRQVKTWMEQVREMAYDAEDSIDEFVHRIGGPCGDGLTGFVRKSMRLLKTFKARHRIATQIQELKARARDVSERHSRYVGSIAGASSSASSAMIASFMPLDPRLPARFVEETQIVAIDKRRDKLLGYLMDENFEQTRVIAIHGFGGVGKTTLVAATYESPRAKTGHFQCRAFITVSQKYDVKALLRDILRQVIPKNEDAMTMVAENAYHEVESVKREDPLKGFETWEVAQLAIKLREHLHDKRYFIILDDIWRITAWDDIRFAIPRNNIGSRIVVTTRIKTVAEKCCSDTHDIAYEIDPLEKDEAKELFFKRVFRQDNVSCPDNLHAVSETILHKCGGIPLAIVSIAGILANKPINREQWLNLSNSLSSESESSPTLERISKILLLSYNDLPYHMKTCFLYFSVFPEDHKIEKESLMRRWLAEGFLNATRALTMEQVAESYFNEFVNRNMIQPVAGSFIGEVSSCRVHDIMLEVIVSKSLEENFVSLISNQCRTILYNKVRRLSIHDEGTDYASTGLNLCNIRSFSIFNDAAKLPAFDQMRLVRVLDLKGCKRVRTRHLKIICRLFLLKYLGLRFTSISKVPNQIRKLQELETLDMYGTDVEQLPVSIGDLSKLLHLITPMQTRFAFALSHQHWKMKALQRLEGIQISDCTSWIIQEIGCLTQLTYLSVCLSIEKEDNLRSLLSFLMKLSKCLRTLRVVTNSKNVFEFPSDSSPPLLLQCLAIGGGLRKYSAWIAPLHDLAELTIGAIVLKEDEIKEISKLPNLQHLKLLSTIELPGQTVMSVKGDFVAPKDGFPRLQSIVVGCSNQKVRFEEGSMPNLEILHLTIFSGGTLAAINGIEFLPNLKKTLVTYSTSYIDDDYLNTIRMAVNNNHNKPTFSHERGGPPSWWNDL